MTDPQIARQIRESNRRRHAHRTQAGLEFCRNCGSFIDKGDPDSAGRVRYRCSACQHTILEYYGQHNRGKQSP